MQRASTFDEFGSAVSEAFPRLSRQLQHIAQFVLEHPDEVALGTVAMVAERAGVQPSALIRFASALQFAGFTDMQQVFRTRLLDRSSSYRDRIDAMRRSKQPDAQAGRNKKPPLSSGGLLHQFVSEGVAELSHLEDNVQSSDLNGAADLICKAKRVHVLAQRRAFPIACYLAYALAQLDVKVQLLDGVGGMLGDVLRQVDQDEILLVASFKNYSHDVVEAAESAHARGVPVIAITDFALSPLKPHARICFELGQASDAAFRSLVAPLCLAQALVVSVGDRLVAPRSAGVQDKPRSKAKADANAAAKVNTNGRGARR
jgi:DNA-binding MurR/RpiR family transcriptional regulator